MSNRLVIVSFLDKAPTEAFRSFEWPLHMTLLPPFIYDGPFETISNKLGAIALQTDPFTVRTNGEALFGQNEDIPVSLIEPGNYLPELHSKLTSLVTKLGIEDEDRPLNENSYRFHITTQRSQKAPDYTDLQINGFSLVDRQTNGMEGLKKVLKTFDFAKT